MKIKGENMKIFEYFKKIKLEISIIKPEFKLAHLKHKIEIEKKNYNKLKKEKEDWINSDTLVSLENCYILKNKDKFYIVLKHFSQINENAPIEKWDGNYTGYLKDLFSGNTICHFKQTINYKKENFDFILLPSKWTDYELNPILDYLEVNDINNNQILMSKLKELYLKLNTKNKRLK